MSWTLPPSAMAVSRLAAMALVIALAGCVQAPPREAPASSEPFVAPATVSDEEGPVLARNAEFVVVVVQPGEDLSRLAERWLGERSKRAVIAEFNHVEEVKAGQTIAIPLKSRNPFGIRAGGLPAITILCYHRFGSRPSSMTVTPQAFEAQMAYLAHNGYTVVSLERLPALPRRPRADAAQGRRDHDRRRLSLDIRGGVSDPAQVQVPGDGVPVHRFRRRRGRA